VRAARNEAVRRVQRLPVITSERQAMEEVSHEIFKVLSRADTVIHVLLRWLRYSR
jgi:hypothetical protein